MISPYISVIVPVYNVSKYLKRCIDSVLHQTFKNIELILVDDGSMDDSYNICKRYSERYKNVFAFTKKNSGSSATRAYGLNKAKGTWICFLDSDDALPPSSLMDLFIKTQETNADIVLGGVSKILKNSKKHPRRMYVSGIISQKQYIEALLKLHCYVGPCGKLIRRSLFDERTFDIDDRINHNEDLIMNIHLALKTDLVAVFPNIEVYWYYTNDGSITSQQTHIDMWDKVLAELDNCLGDNYRIQIDYYIMMILYKPWCNNLLDRLAPSCVYERILKDFPLFNKWSGVYCYACYFIHPKKSYKVALFLYRVYRNVLQKIKTMI